MSGGTAYDYPFSIGTSARAGPPDTAPRKTKTLNLTGSRTKAADVEKMVKNDISDGNVHLAETNDFLSKLFPIDTSVLDTVFETLVESGEYNSKKNEWKDLPTDEKRESRYYAPFVKIAESIRKASPTLSVTLESSWMDRHSKFPKSRDQDASLIRPDVLNILGMAEEQAKWEVPTNDDKEKVGAASSSPGSSSRIFRRNKKKR